jgi:hypothetical protein
MITPVRAHGCEPLETEPRMDFEIWGRAMHSVQSFCCLKEGCELMGTTTVEEVKVAPPTAVPPDRDEPADPDLQDRLAALRDAPTDKL